MGEPTTQELIDTVAERAGSPDPMIRLQTAVTVAELVGQTADATVDHYVAAARAAGLSWTEIGQRLGVSKQAARQKFSPRLDVSGGAVTEPAGISPRLAACVDVARDAAATEGVRAGTQHLLLGLLHVGAAATVLDRLGVTGEKIRHAGAELLAESGGDGEADAALLQARRFAANRGQNLAAPEHLLFVLALDSGSSARRILNHLGVDPAQVKKELADLIPQPPHPRRLGRRTGKPQSAARACSFCGCTDPSRPMVNGPGVQICADCITIATDILRTKTE